MKSSLLRSNLLMSLVLGLVCGLASVVRAGQPVAPSVTGPDYSVTYSNDYSALYMYLYERQGASGTSQYVSESEWGETENFTAKPSGDYYYFTTELFVYYDEYWTPIYYYWNSPETHVNVLGGATLTPEPLVTQLTYQYEARAGDINYDGLTDLFVNRTSGGQSGDGTLGAFILQQVGYLSFTAIVPDAYQASVASAWPITNVDIVLDDVDVDGFADVITKGVSAVTGGVKDHIVYAPGTIGNLQPSAIHPRTFETYKFVRDVNQWFGNPNYFDNAYAWTEVWFMYWSCPGYFPDWYPYDYWENPPSWCYLDWYFAGYELVFDSYSYSSHALSFVGIYNEAQQAGGVFAGTWGEINISNIFEYIFGKRPIIFSQADIPYPGDIPGEVDIPWKKFALLSRALSIIGAVTLIGGDTPGAYPLYRVVEDAELASIRACHCFSLGGPSIVKQFWKNPVDATWYATTGMRRLSIADRPRTMLRIIVSRYVYELGYQGPEPETSGWLAYDEATLQALNADILSKPIAELRRWEAE